MKIGMDVAASEFLTEDKQYDLDFKAENNDGSMKKTGAQMIDLYQEFISEYPMISIEDPFDQDDAENTAALTAKGNCQIVGDDLLVTNPSACKSAIDDKWCNALLLKVNQIGTISESIEAVGMSKAAGWGVMASTDPARRKIPSSPTSPWVCPPAKSKRAPVPLRASLQVQPAPPHRGRARRQGGVRGEQYKHIAW